MATQEERVTTLEQSFTSFQREQARQNRKTDENLTILLGLVQTQSLESKRISARLETIDERLDGMDQRLGGVETRLNGVETRLDRVENLLGQILERLPKP